VLLQLEAASGEPIPGGDGDFGTCSCDDLVIFLQEVCVVPATPVPSPPVAAVSKQRTINDLFLDLNMLPEWDQFEQQQNVDYSDESSREEALMQFLTWKVRACVR
jgi:hypothetical protein